MDRDLATLQSTRFDLLVVGGGIYGLAAAADAAARGLRVALVDRHDFGSVTSFNHLKTIHGGLRYLQSGDLRRVRQSIRERRALARIAPHLLEPLPFMMATRGLGTRSRAAMGAAFLADALLGYDRNERLAPGLALPRGRVLARRRCPPAFLETIAGAADGGALWYDYQTRNTDRLTLAFALAAARHGATLANYVEATAPLGDRGRVEGMEVRDGLTDARFEIRAAITLNAAGAGAVPLMRAIGAPCTLRLIKAMNVVTTRPATPPAIGSPTRDGRLLFLVPWRDRACIGTSHSQRLFEPGDTGVSASELDAFVSEIGEAFPRLGLTADEVSLVHRGLVPAERDRRGRLTLSGHTFLRDHAADGVEGAVTVVGVKYTTARGVAERVVDLVARKLHRDGTRSRTASTPLPGAIEDLQAALDGARCPPGVAPDIVRQLVETYGSEWGEVLVPAGDTPARLERVAPGSPVILAQVQHAVRAEMARRLPDVVIRRTPLGSAGHPGADVVRRVAAVMAGELGWSEARMAAEMAAVDDFYRLSG